MSLHRICVLPGDGIGPEVIDEALRVLQALPVEWDFVTADIGYGAYQKRGSPLPEETLEKIHSTEAALFGAVTTPPNIPGYFSPIVRLRQTLDMYANLRPCRSLPHPSSRPGIDLLVVRENTEDLYLGRERVEDGGDTAVAEMVITRRASERIARKAFDLARGRGSKKVTVVHKANVLRQTCGLFRSAALEVAKEYPEIKMEEMLVDTCAMELVRQPEQFEVIVTTNLFGDILSDEASMLVGGLGVACSSNIGDNYGLFEPVHGSAPTLAGTNKANPMATFLSAALMLDFLEEGQSAERLRGAVIEAIRRGQVSEDLGGSLSTSQVTDAVMGLLNVNR
jgi:homoisocitrate dehydrogenase